jgi:hypothetical protein
MGFVNGKVSWVLEQQSKKKAGGADTLGSLVRTLFLPRNPRCTHGESPFTGTRPNTLMNIHRQGIYDDTEDSSQISFEPRGQPFRGSLANLLPRMQDVYALSNGDLSSFLRAAHLTIFFCASHPISHHAPQCTWMMREEIGVHAAM